MSITPGQRIKELRTLAGMSQEELGNRLGVQRAAINKYEKGTIENIPLKNIEKIATMFDVSPTYIVGWNEDNTNPLSAEVKVLQGVKKFYGAEAVQLLEYFSQLTTKGKRRVFQNASDMFNLYRDQDRLPELEIDDK